MLIVEQGQHLPSASQRTRDARVENVSASPLPEINDMSNSEGSSELKNTKNFFKLSNQNEVYKVKSHKKDQEQA